VKKVLIVGSTGFIGCYLSKYLSSCYVVSCIDKNNVDVLNTNHLSTYLKQNKFNAVINCLTFGGKEDVNSFDSKFVEKNFTLFYNFYINSEHYNLFVNIGSGAEFDKTTNIDLVKENEIFSKHPKEAYGFLKNSLARIINNQEKFTTLRLFGCFGKEEPSMRLLKRYQQQHLLIADRYFDFFSVQDFAKVVKHVVDNNLDGVDINCVYPDKIKISEFLSSYDTINKRQSNFTITSLDDKNYTGDSSLLSALGVKLDGLDYGLGNYNV